MFEESEYEAYFLYKMWLNLLMDDEIDIDLHKWSYSIDALEFLNNQIDLMIEDGSFDDIIKNNIQEFLNKIRYIKDEYTSERINVINKIIIKLNKINAKFSIDWLRNEVCKRTGSTRYLKADIPEQIAEDVINSMAIDGYVLLSHGKHTDDKKFKEQYLEPFSYNNCYYYSLNAILAEFPYVFENKVFYNRIMEIINFENENSNDKRVAKENKQYVKDLNMQIKSFSKYKKKI